MIREFLHNTSDWLSELRASGPVWNDDEAELSASLVILKSSFEDEEFKELVDRLIARLPALSEERIELARIQFSEMRQRRPSRHRETKQRLIATDIALGDKPERRPIARPLEPRELMELERDLYVELSTLSAASETYRGLELAEELQRRLPSEPDTSESTGRSHPTSVDDRALSSTTARHGHGKGPPDEVEQTSGLTGRPDDSDLIGSTSLLASRLEDYVIALQGWPGKREDISRVLDVVRDSHHQSLDLLRSMAMRRAAGLREFMSESPLSVPPIAVAALTLLGLAGAHAFYFSADVPILEYASTIDLLRWGIIYSPLSLVSISAVFVAYQWLFRRAQKRIQAMFDLLDREDDELDRMRPGRAAGFLEKRVTFYWSPTELSVLGAALSIVFVSFVAYSASLELDEVDYVTVASESIQEASFMGTTATAAVYQSDNGGYFLLERDKILCQAKRGSGESHCREFLVHEHAEPETNTTVLWEIASTLEALSNAANILVSQDRSGEPLSLDAYVHQVLSCEQDEGLSVGVPEIYFPSNSETPCSVGQPCSRDSFDDAWEIAINSWILSWRDIETPPRVWVLGLASTLGPSIHNYDLADRRARAVTDAVRRSVGEKLSVDVGTLYPIIQARSLGEDVLVGRSSDQRADRRVEIIVCR